MVHFPVNHPMRPLVRTMAGLIGAFILLFGIVGMVRTAGTGMFAQDDLPRVFWLSTNRGFALLSVAAGAVILIAVLIGRNVDSMVNFAMGAVFIAAGLAMLALLRSDLNILGFSVTNCVVSFVFGMLLLAASLYGRVGTVEQARAEEAFRHGR